MSCASHDLTSDFNFHSDQLPRKAIAHPSWRKLNSGKDDEINLCCSTIQKDQPFIMQCQITWITRNYIDILNCVN